MCWTRLLAGTVLSSVYLSALILAGCDGPSKTQGAPPPPAVYVATVARRSVPLFTEAVASLDGYINADIRARVRGYLKTQEYKDGASVKVGQLLFTIEPTEYVAAVSSARASLLRAHAALAHNRALAERDRALFQTGVVSQQEVDNAVAALADANGQVQAAEAQLAQAALNLSYTQIRSPIDGVAGIALVRVGNLVGQEGPTLLTTASQVDPIRVTFPMSEVDYLRYPYRSKLLDARDVAWAKGQFAKLDAEGATADGDQGVDLLLSDGSRYAHRGVVVSANRQIDPSTGTIQLQALIANPDWGLRPGQYGRVRIKRQDTGEDVLTVPEKALISVQRTYSVGVVGPGNKVQLRKVEVGPSALGLRIVQKGVSDGERIVVEGVQKISDGTVVDPRPVPASTAAATEGAASLQGGPPRARN